ncbi:hypothetical protein HOO54_00915 [Bacillus sp. WMMC1349]|uniref:hypothetical protein n=1 Tax=Bacillus sp. WMMC1349 TaxID=2736254 RepID=UPI001555046B|nr:hypothetical protein [Bacillus sp. WMMC1349]NPC90865.1 hypothetical protein [Bacillus sp. WMMC1349]
MKEIKTKDLIQFRLPVDTPEVVIKKINKLKKQHAESLEAKLLIGYQYHRNRSAHQ